MKPFYITTAIDYTNGSPHLGHAYEKVLTDVVARFRRLKGDQVHFLTGVDEHGQKVQQSAKERGVAPQQYVDEVSAEFRALLPELNISNDDFIRTTEERHKRIVRQLLQQLFDQGEIYQAEYRGFYSARQEQFLQEKDRQPDGSWPEIYGEVTEITENNHFFKLQKHQAWLVDFLTQNEDFIFPRYRQKQVLEFLKEPLNDLCISRPRERLEWGIPLPFDDKYVTYVWFDALVNYYSAVADTGCWPADCHVIGKDILVPPHAVYWPIMLHALGLPLPKSLLVHGWWSVNGVKMSKSTGNFIVPSEYTGEFGVDALRYFLIREMNVGQDSDFTRAQFLVRYNSELANNLGNLVNRTLNMTNRFAAGVVPAAETGEEPEAELRALWEKTRDEFVPLCAGFQFHTALDRLFAFVTATNAYIEKRAPWKLGKSTEAADAARLRTSLATMAEALRLAAAALQPVMPGTTEKINEVLGNAPAGTWTEQLAWGSRLTGAKVAVSLVLFPRPAEMTILPLDPAANRSPEALQGFLEQCRAVAARLGRPQLVSISLNVDALDPLAVLESIFEPGERHFYVERPDEQMAVAGAEAVLAFTASGPGRFEACQRFIDQTLENTLAVGDLTAPFAGPHFFAAFSFDLAEPGEPFEAASVFVPRWQVARQAGRTVAVANLPIAADSPIARIAEKVWRAHAKFGAFDYTAPDFTGTEAVRPAAVAEVEEAGAYQAAVGRALQEIAGGAFEKIVLARAKDLTASGPLHPLRVLNGLRQRFGDCFAFSVANGRGQSFIGASPERLLSVRDGTLRTEALAGSTRRGATASDDAGLAAALSRDEKELREHRLVSDFIVERLKSLGLQPEYPAKPGVRRFANVQHLHTPVRAALSGDRRLLGVLAQLHPTPAVGGVPRAAAVPLIRGLEGFPRGLYAGALGWIDSRGGGEFFVGLRSALIDGPRARLYAGAGIVAGSTPEKELAETELKFRAMQEALLS